MMNRRVHPDVLSAGARRPELMRPAWPRPGLAGLVLTFGMVGPIGNQFGYDRFGLPWPSSSVPPRAGTMLMGKNLAVLPFALAMDGGDGRTAAMAQTRCDSIT